MDLAVRYAEGTQRLVSPEETLARVTPHLAAVGVTRVADITGLDRLGIPTFCAVRPQAFLVQVTNGKGLTPAAARASAIMEAVEHAHSEWPPSAPRFASMAELAAEGTPFLPVDALPNRLPGLFMSDNRRLAWIEARNLTLDGDGGAVLVTACAAHLIDPIVALPSTNGLASGNHIVEATLHALYELIERDAVTRLGRGGLRLPKGLSRLIDLGGLPEGPVAGLRDRLTAAGVELVLIRVETLAPVTTMWAVLLDPDAQHACSRVNMGQGSHLSPTIAATRAITEAAQSRLTFIHGAREDLSADSYRFTPAHARLVGFFQGRRGDLAWSDLPDHSSGDLGRDLALVLGGLAAAGFGQVLRIDLTRRDPGIPVVKLVVPGFAFHPVLTRAWATR
ncbi:MAG: YcaO-like family protein [Alphaproteobacteria bacterium]|nr:YcaO-like family protein [Alphaproteobacteria bacterium]MBF0391131.1 YcaO-like family protein [Alphaproteobacteria bacterium]